jgi:hypothetical protein
MSATDNSLDRRLEPLLKSVRATKRDIKVDLSDYPDLSIREVAYILSRSVRMLGRANGNEAKVIFKGLTQRDKEALLKGITYRDDVRILFEEETRFAIALLIPRHVYIEGKKKPLVIGRSRRRMAFIIERDGNECVWCSNPLSFDHPQASLDHLIPDSQGGGSYYENLVLACSDCNSFRDLVPAREWITQREAAGEAVRRELLEKRLAELDRYVAELERIERVSALTRSSPYAAEWCEKVGAPDISDEDFLRYTNKLNTALHDALERAPLLREIASKTLFFLDNTPDETGVAYTSATADEPQSLVVAIYPFRVGQLTHEQLVFTLAHELTHLRLNGSLEEKDSSADSEEVRRLQLRAGESLTNDHVEEAGIPVPTDFPVPTPTGIDNLGFCHRGLSVFEAWQCVCGIISRTEALSLIAGRGGVMQKSGFESAMSSPPKEALEFWATRHGRWQEEWATPHDQLVEKLRSNQ